MSLRSSFAAPTEDQAALQLAELLKAYGITFAATNNIKRLFEENWSTLSRLGHELHNAQERNRARADRQAAQELYSPEHEEISG